MSGETRLQELREYDVVRVLSLSGFEPFENCMAKGRPPRVGDQAAIVQRFERPRLAFMLECCAEDGGTHWLLTVQPAEGDLERIDEVS